jgi:hypothetical protein
MGLARRVSRPRLNCWYRIVEVFICINALGVRGYGTIKKEFDEGPLEAGD